MPKIGTAGPVTYPGQLATLPASDDNNYTEFIVTSTENQPVTFNNNTVQYQKSSGNAAQTFITTV